MTETTIVQPAAHIFDVDAYSVACASGDTTKGDDLLFRVLARLISSDEHAHHMTMGHGGLLPVSYDRHSDEANVGLALDCVAQIAERSALVPTIYAAR